MKLSYGVYKFSFFLVIVVGVLLLGYTNVRNIQMEQVVRVAGMLLVLVGGAGAIYCNEKQSERAG